MYRQASLQVVSSLLVDGYVPVNFMINHYLCRKVNTSALSVQVQNEVLHVLLHEL